MLEGLLAFSALPSCAMLVVHTETQGPVPYIGTDIHLETQKQRVSENADI